MTTPKRIWMFRTWETARNGRPGRLWRGWVSICVVFCAIHKPGKLLLYLALWWWSHFYKSARHLDLATNKWIVYQRRCIVYVYYFYASCKWMDVNPWSRDTAVSLLGHCGNGMVRLVYSVLSKWAKRWISQAWWRSLLCNVVMVIEVNKHTHSCIRALNYTTDLLIVWSHHGEHCLHTSCTATLVVLPPLLLAEVIWKSPT